MMRSGGGLIMVLARINSLLFQQLFPLNVGPIAIKVKECCKAMCGGGEYRKLIQASNLYWSNNSYKDISPPEFGEDYHSITNPSCVSYKRNTRHFLLLCMGWEA